MTPSRITRRDDGLALRALRVGAHPGALIIHVGTDVVVRTPARVDDPSGNVVDLLVPPTVGELPSRIEGVRRLLEPVGVDRPHLRYELPPDAPDADDRVAALAAAGFELRALEVRSLPAGSLAEDAPHPPPDVAIERLAVPDGDVIAERRWYAAAVLHRYAHGEDVAVWRAWDQEWGGWERERVLALGRLGRAEVWLATRHGMPVAMATLVDDRDGLVVIDALITHPAHRRRGIARALLGAALSSLRASAGLERVAIAAPGDHPVVPLVAAAGFLPVGEVRSWRRPAGWTAGTHR